MASQVLPSIDDLRQCLRLDPAAGKLYWTVHRGGMKPGEEAFASVSKSLGYRCGGVLGWKGLAHKVIWALHYGEWPKLSIDHISGDKLDNRILNLRLATSQQNRANQGKSTGRYKKGAQFVSTCRARPWRAAIFDGSRIKSLGYFRCETAAHLAYLREAKVIHGDFARTRA